MPTIKPELRWLTDPTVFAVNRLDAHSDHVAYRTLEEAVADRTSLRQSLDGEWRFAWSPNPAARPADFWRPEADLSGFGTIRVPGHIELQGYGELQYTNTLYPWDGRAALRPPQIDWDNAPGGQLCNRLHPGRRAAGPAGLHQLPGRRAGPVPMVQRCFCGLRRGQLHPLGV